MKAIANLIAGIIFITAATATVLVNNAFSTMFFTAAGTLNLTICWVDNRTTHQRVLTVCSETGE